MCWALIGIVHENKRFQWPRMLLRVASIFFATRAEEHVLTDSHAVLGIPIGVRPTTRKNASVARLLLEAQGKVIGHLAKRALLIGEACQVFGLDLTMGSVAVIVLEISGVGTSEVKIAMQRTKPLPLFDAETRCHLLGETARDVDASFDVVKAHKGIPAGFCLLARMLMSGQPGLGASLTKNSDCNNLSMRIDNSESVREGPHLGSGACAHVLELDLDETKDASIKVPKSPQMRRSLERETDALEALPGREGIHQLQDNNYLIKTPAQCFPLRGLIGHPASQHLDVRSKRNRKRQGNLHGLLGRTKRKRRRR
jgi:hypothetical protein